MASFSSLACSANALSVVACTPAISISIVSFTAVIAEVISPIFIRYP